MKLAQSLKVIGAILLLLSMTLPMSSCTEDKQRTNEQLSSAQQSHSPNSSATSAKEYHYIIDNIDVKDPATWLTLLAFVWPVVMLGLLRWKNTGRGAMNLRGLELLLIIGSLIWVDFIATFLTDRREIGAYLAYAALVIYAIGAIRCDVLLYRSWKSKAHH